MGAKLVMKTRKYGYVRKPDLQNPRRQLSKAGKLFATDPTVESVWVGNDAGQTALYLKKDPVTGECIMRERNDIF